VKNKKLFAILTLVCFMFTLMPVAAFAAAPTVTGLSVAQKDNGDVIVTLTQSEEAAASQPEWDLFFVVDGVNKDQHSFGISVAEGKTTGTKTFPANDVAAYTAAKVVGTGVLNAAPVKSAKIDADMIAYAETADAWADWKAAATGAGDATADNHTRLQDAYEVTGYIKALKDDGITEAAMNTIVAKNVTNANSYYDGLGVNTVDYTKSDFQLDKPNPTVDINEIVKATVTLKEFDGTTGTLTGSDKVYVWAESKANTASQALTVIEGVEDGNTGLWVLDDTTGVVEIQLQFATNGTYTVYAAILDGTPGAIKDINTKLTTSPSYSVVTVEAPAVNSEDYTMDVRQYDSVGEDWDAVIADVNTDDDAEVEHEGTAGTITVDADGVAVTDVRLTMKYLGSELTGLPVTVTTNSASIEVSDTNLTTDHRGNVYFSVSGTIEGTYEIDVTCMGYKATILVQVGSVAASDIELTKEPAAPIALYTTAAEFANTTTGVNEVEFYIADVNGNGVTAGNIGVSKAENSYSDANNADRYVAFTDKPAKSKLENDDIKIAAAGDGTWYLQLKPGTVLDAEGTYTVKAVLDNGKSATATWEVKKFQTPVRIIYGVTTDTIELGATINGSLKYMDANGVMKTATDADFVADGYAVAGQTSSNGSFTLTAKTDEKYVGATIKTTAVSTKYDLVATKAFKVAEGAAEIAFADASADVNVNNRIAWNVVDAAGNKVALMGGNNDTVNVTDIKYVVLDKPEGAKVSVNDASTIKDILTTGAGKLALTSNKVGNVTVQVILAAEYVNVTAETKQVKYYTGTAVIPVGTDNTGDVVVMSIGSNQIVKNDEVATMVAAPIVKDARTFVPFRALAEAFGAEVAWDEATQSVTAELNGVKVVMTIGSAEYTVNGEARTADVAPFINGASTMVPVRFAAQAFGIKVIPTYDENGATADILFNL